MEEKEKEEAKGATLKKLFDRLREMQAGQEIREANFMRERRAFFLRALENLERETKDFTTIFLFAELILARERELREAWEEETAIERWGWNGFESASVRERLEFLKSFFTVEISHGREFYQKDSTLRGEP